MIYIPGDSSLVGRIIPVEILEKSGNGLKARMTT
jgi:hypothetical protein